jgi:phytoene dehydrogenase-like protein
MRYDAIVVGGGIAGLTAAAYLSKSGKRVALFEKQESVGGLVQTFQRNGIYFDAGLRSIENSGIVFPMLRQLGIEMEWMKSEVSIGIGDKVLRLKDQESLEDYEDFLAGEFPENKEDIHRIILEIRKIMQYMDVLYGLDNPAFKDLMKDKKYLFTVLMPWMFSFLITIRKIYKLNDPVDEYLERFTKNQQLIDIIAQHFFQKTPTSFALSYFSLYLDYHYPKGGTAVLVEKITDFVKEKGCVLHMSTSIEALNPEQKYVMDSKGEKHEYGHLVWAADMKQLYNTINVEEITNRSLAEKIKERKRILAPLRGGDSVYTVYMSVGLDREYFNAICTGHFFYTPSKAGLSSVDKSDIEHFISLDQTDPTDKKLKEKVKHYLEAYCDENTFEIAIPALRDPDLAPEGQTGLVVSLLFDYALTKKIEESGWMEEMSDLLEKRFIKILDESIFPGLKDKVQECFSSSPLTIEKRTNSTHGGITGWAFTNPMLPAVDKMLQVNTSTKTILPDVFQAGQWVYSPSGLPISILTGKLAADRVLKRS